MRSFGLPPPWPAARLPHQWSAPVTPAEPLGCNLRQLRSRQLDEATQLLRPGPHEWVDLAGVQACHHHSGKIARNLLKPFGGTGRPILISVREEPARSSLSPVWRDRGRGGLTNECRSEFFAEIRTLSDGGAPWQEPICRINTKPYRLNILRVDGCDSLGEPSMVLLQATLAQTVGNLRVASSFTIGPRFHRRTT